MKNLKVIIFQQSWFQLGCTLECIVKDAAKFDRIDLYFLSDGLFVKPLDLHQDFFADTYFSKRPEIIVKDYLELFFYDQPGKFIFHDTKISRNFKYQKLFIDFEDLKKLQSKFWEKTALGMAISSFIITYTRDSNPRLRKYKHLIHNLSLTYQQIFYFLHKIDISSDYNEIWLWNGRSFHERAVVEFFKEKLVDVKFMELGGDGIDQDRWILLDNSPHDRVMNQKHILNHFNYSEKNLSEIQKWFTSQHSGGSNIYSKKFIMDPNLKIDGKLFVFFSSSDDEVAAISSDWESAWGNQINAVNKLIEFFEGKPEYNLIIRVHPNQKNKSKNDKKIWSSLKSKTSNITIYGFDSKVDSYQLLSLANGVITYGSTLGIEAAYLKKPAALLSHALWDIVIPQQYISTDYELSDWVDGVASGSKTDLVHLEQCYSGSLVLAHYKLTAGNSWSLIETHKMRNKKVGFVRGICLRPNSFIIALTRVTRWCRFQLIEKRLYLKS